MSLERPENQPALRDLFLRALELPSEPERDAYLQEIHSQHPEFYPKLVALLRNEKEDSFLEYPAADGVGTLAVSAPLTEGPGTTIGKYKLLEQLGEGGFGVVYMAEQKEPVKRRVALKIIKVGMDTREVVARFEAERQALAIMDHPNIAKVHDGGATETGRPYFVMELVRGVEITKYCDEKNLSTRERLDLFTQVCHAVQHAHQKGIIHRDLKPSNILVTVNDGVPVPKIIDFGIAKATQLELTEKTVFTRFHQFIGTPAYLSPEQADISSVDIDTRSDIYSLGVLLYELLTGRTPFDGKELLKIGLDEMRRTIREKEPERPSTRVSTLGADELTTTAKRRGVEPPKLTHVLRGDLDWIVMKCLEKDRARRYETANGLAMDIQRHLSNEPVVACPPSGLYRFQKMARRNKLAFAAGAGVAAALFLGLCVATWGLVRERRARQEQARLRQVAEGEKTKAQQISQFLGDMLHGAGPEVAKGRDATILNEILDQTAERIGRELGSQPDVQADLLRLIGNVYMDLGQYNKAEKVLRRALEINRASGHERAAELAAARGDLGTALHFQGRLYEADALLREDLAMKTNLFGSDHPFLAQTLGNYAAVLLSEGKLSEAEATYRQALGIFKRHWGNENNSVAICLRSLGDTLLEEGKLTEAESALREALGLMKKLHGDVDPQVAAALGSLGLVLRDQGKLDQAEMAMREALVKAEKLFASDHAEVGRYINNLASLLDKEGKFHEAELLHRRALAISRKAFGDEHPRVATSLNNLAIELERQDKFEEAEPLMREALALRRKLFGPEHPDLANSLKNLGGLLQEEGRFDQAASMIREALAMYRKLLGGESPQLASCLNNLGSVLQDQEKFPEAEPLLHESLAMRRKLFGNEHPEVANSLNNLGVLLKSMNRFPEAAATFREASGMQRKLVGNEHPALGRSLANLGEVLRRQGQLDEARATLSEALAIQQKALGTNNLDFAGSLNFFGRLLMDQGRLSEAETAVSGALAIRRKLLASDHPAVVESLTDLAGVLAKQGKLAEAEAKARESLALTKETPPFSMHVADCVCNLASILIHQKKLDEADQLYEKFLSSGAGGQSTNARVLEARGNLFSRRGRWDQAEACLTSALASKPADDSDYWVWYYLAAVLVQQKSPQAYQAHCHKCLERFAQVTDPDSARWVSRACLILPSSGADLEAASRLAGLAAAAETNHADWTGFAANKALAEFRQGRLATALEWAQQAISRSDLGAPNAVETYSIAAMARYQLNQAASAADELAAARQIADTKLPKLESGDLGGGAFSWIIAQALLREASGLIEPEKKPNPDSN